MLKMNRDCTKTEIVPPSRGAAAGAHYYLYPAWLGKLNLLLEPLAARTHENGTVQAAVGRPERHQNTQGEKA